MKGDDAVRQDFELLIFDWDGTLADSTGQIVALMQEAITALDLPPREDEEIRSLIGLGFQDGLSRLYPEADAAELARALLHHRQHLRGAPPTPAPLYPGAAEVLRLLRQRGHRLAVATGKPRRGLDHALLHHGLHDDAFHATRTADETADKPHPQMVLELLEALRVPPQRALVIGDTDYDLHMARAAGVPAVAVLGGAHGAGRLQAAKPAALLEGVAQLPAWLATAAAVGADPRAGN